MQRDADGAFAAGRIAALGLTIGTNPILATGGAVGSGDLAPNGTGSRFLWYPRKASIRAGRLDVAGTGSEWNDANIGLYSTAFGNNTLASGQSSLAVGSLAQATAASAVSLGFSTQATGANSIAMGSTTVASGVASFSVGYLTTASNTGSIALGNSSSSSGAGAVAIGLGPQASALGAVAIGVDAIASGIQSVAIGSAASTNGQEGALVFGDHSTTTNVTATANNQFVVRAAGGYTLYSNSAMTSGVELPAGGGSFTSLSDRDRKQGFSALDGEQVLSSIRTMPIEEWSYTTESASVRHVGPTAQDFRAAFGLGTSDRTITLVDIDGINLFAVQQLILRSDALKTENAALRSEVNDLKARLERLERLVDRR